MGPRLAPFALHEWHNDNDPKARIGIGASGWPRAEITPYLPKSRDEIEWLWSTPPNDLLDAVKDQLGRAYGFAREEILVTEGASEADFIAALGVAGPGAHVVIEKPAYYALLEPARALGCKVTRVPRSAADGFALDAKATRRAITKKTRLVALARPNNPTGARVPDDELVDIADAATKVRAHVLVDEVFAEATPAGDVPARRLHDSILSVNSVTKCLGFGPLHVGWIAGPSKVIATLHDAKAHTRPLNPSLSLALAARILANRGSILEKTRARRRANAELLRRMIPDLPGVDWRPQEHGTTTVLRLPAAHRDDVAFARTLLAKQGVMVSPGSFLEMPGWIRIGLLVETAKLQEGLEAVADALSTPSRVRARTTKTVA